MDNVESVKGREIEGGVMRNWNKEKAASRGLTILVAASGFEPLTYRL